MNLDQSQPLGNQINQRKLTWTQGGQGSKMLEADIKLALQQALVRSGHNQEPYTLEIHWYLDSRT